MCDERDLRVNQRDDFPGLRLASDGVGKGIYVLVSDLLAHPIAN